jgi:transcription-repair coupling factor (superfamily II helicase)
VQSLARRLEQGGVLSCAGISEAAHPFVVALLQNLSPGRTLLAVAEDLRQQELLQQDIATWLRVQSAGVGAAIPQPLFFPSWEVLPHEARLPHADVISDRLETLITLSSDPTARIIVSTAPALMQRTFPPQHLRERMRVVAPGDRVEPLDMIDWLEQQGYEPEAQVTHKGEIALRGGILDIYPPTSPWPVRLEFFGDELESLRQFDPLTQISREAIARVTLSPAGELGILKQFLRANPAAQAGAVMATLLDYLPPKSILVLCEPQRLSDKARDYASQVPDGDPFFSEWSALLQRAAEGNGTVVELRDSETAFLPDDAESPGDVPEGESGEIAAVEAAPLFRSLEDFRPLPARAPEPPVAEAQRREFFQQLHRWLRQDYAVCVFCNNEGERQRFAEIWKESFRPGAEPDAAADLSVQEGSLSRGFLCDDAKVVVVTDAEIFGRYKVQRPRRLKSLHAQAARSALDIDFTELEEGDYVVHVQHGIGRYAGLKPMPTGLGTRGGEEAAPTSGTECLVIEYAPSDPSQPPPKLYVPVTEAHLVSKYVGAGKARPPLNTLTGGRWKKTREQAERAVRDIASELLSIQAAREQQPGHAFAPDVPWQREFEAAFIFEETPDQLSAIQETKADMERPKPMDRLICGDVGFGKTEVAIRAAFKAVMDGRQAAVLVPTTVLAQQHFNTFRERMADYPIRVELLSRFRTRRMQQRVVKDLAAGSVDVVVGTHRLLQSDVAFKDLGLVIIDEEQRFGVLHKEKFKMLRHMVDVLTLSATPIPRTLYLSLAGARDMSTIQTPPHDRLPVETIVAPYDERLIREAIQREMNRGGQVFFLHNRVMTIETVRQRLSALVPNARVLVGHGQMQSDELEEVMTRFVNGEADVLLSTTIIESGLDIPNANTIIIDRADRFGLSDLYQLRGRVGRYKHQAYAYLLLPRHARVLSDARKRISAIKQYSTLGSGFKIAMRDLEIRGAGNLLGAEQSGHIAAVGFELYCQLLKRSIAALKGESTKPHTETEVRLDFLTLNPGTEPGAPAAAGPNGPAAAACIPLEYISDAKQRIEIYRKFAQVETRAELESLKSEMRDRFGAPPAAVELLLQVAELKVIASGQGIAVIEVKENRLMLTRNGDYIMFGGRFPRLARKEAGARLKEIKRLLTAL